MVRGGWPFSTCVSTRWILPVAGKRHFTCLPCATFAFLQGWRRLSIVGGCSTENIEFWRSRRELNHRRMLLPHNAWEFFRDDAGSFFDGDELVDRNLGQVVNGAAGPRDLE
jgi:hypothetical protein